MEELVWQEPQMQEYKLATSDDFGHLEHQVNELLKEGWQLHGAPVLNITPDDHQLWLVQALVKYATPGEALLMQARAAVGDKIEMVSEETALQETYASLLAETGRV